VPPSTSTGGLVTRYIELGLALGRHIDGFVDAYYGPPALAAAAAAAPMVAPDVLQRDARTLLAALDAGEPLGSPMDDAGPPVEGEDSRRRRWLRAQTVGLLTSTRILGGASIGYADEVAACYGVRPTRFPEEEIL
jgi:hypothetical protein